MSLLHLESIPNGLIQYLYLSDITKNCSSVLIIFERNCYVLLHKGCDRLRPLIILIHMD